MHLCPNPWPPSRTSGQRPVELFSHRHMKEVVGMFIAWQEWDAPFEIRMWCNWNDCTPPVVNLYLSSAPSGKSSYARFEIHLCTHKIPTYLLLVSNIFIFKNLITRDSLCSAGKKESLDESGVISWKTWTLHLIFILYLGDMCMVGGPHTPYPTSPYI